MFLVERHIIKKSHPFYEECDSLCLKSKNLYNQGLYNVRQHYFEHKEYLSYYEGFHQAKTQEAYKQLPAKVSNQTLMLVDQNFRSFFGLLKTMGSMARMPKYLDKQKGRYMVKFDKQALSLREFKKNGRLKLSKTIISMQTNLKDWSQIKEARIIPRNGYYAIEVVYEQQEKALITDGAIAALDCGLNNLATIAFNKNEIQPFIINGRPLKSINQFYNKQRAEAQSKLESGRNTSKAIIKLTNKRNEKIKDYMHKASRILVNQLLKRHVKTLVLGKNVGQKQDINLGKRNNQNFVGIPSFRFLDMVAYKARLEGIEVLWQEESYTSKASFLHGDCMPTYGDGQAIPEFSGYRIVRGLYELKRENRTINADLNGALNILRKAIPNAFADGIEGVAVRPMRLTTTA